LTLKKLKKENHMNNQKQMPLYANMLTLDEVTNEYNHHLKLMEIKPFYKVDMVIGVIGNEAMLFTCFSKTLIKKLGFKIISISLLKNLGYL
jgi:hypothetical protein